MFADTPTHSPLRGGELHSARRLQVPLLGGTKGWVQSPDREKIFIGIFSRESYNQVASIALLAVIIAFNCLAINAQEASSDNDDSLPISDLSRDTPVDFQTEILPVLKNNCLACHNQTKSKADLILETPQTILKGGDSGPSVIPNRGAESLLLQAAAHQDDMVMPPRSNKVNAIDLTPHQLGLLKLWIDQGAKGEVRATAPLAWKPLPEQFNPIYCVAITEDGQHAACSRGNQIFVYHLPSNRLVARLVDSQLTSANPENHNATAHRDVVHALAFSPDTTVLASGGYRQVKLWSRSPGTARLNMPSGPLAPNSPIIVSPDGDQLAFMSTAQVIHLRNLSTGKETAIPRDDKSSMEFLSFSRKGTLLASVSSGNSIRIRSLPDGEPNARIETEDEVRTVAWIADDTLLATSATNGTIRIWSLRGEPNQEPVEMRQLGPHEGEITSLAARTTSGSEIISGSADGILRHWDAETGKLFREMNHGEAITSVAARSDGKRFVSAGLDGSAKLWDSETGELIAEMRGDRYASELAAKTEWLNEFAADEVKFRKTAVTTAEKDLKTEEDRLTKSTKTLTESKSTFSEKEKALSSAKDEKAAAEKSLTELEEELKTVTTEFTTAETAMKNAEAEADAALDRALATKIPADQAAETRSISTKLATDAAVVAAQVKASVSANPDESAESGLENLAEESAQIASQAQGVAERIARDAATKFKIAADAKLAAQQAIAELSKLSFTAGQIRPQFDQITSKAPENRKKVEKQIETATKAIATGETELEKARLALAGAENDVQLTTRAVEKSKVNLSAAKVALEKSETDLEVATAELASARESMKATENPILSVAFSQDNVTVATSDGDAIRTWSSDTGAPFETFHTNDQTIDSIAFARENHLVAQTSNSRALAWNLVHDWTLAGSLGTGESSSPIIGRVNALAFSPDGQHLATGGGEPSRSGEIRIWDAADRSLLRELNNVHSDSVLSLDFSTDGGLLASGATDRFVRVFDLSEGKVVRSLEGHTHHVLGVSWKYDGRTLISAGADNVVKVWNFTTGERKKNIDGFEKEVTAIRFIGTSNQAAVSSGDGQVVIVKENGDKVRSLEGSSDFMYAVAVTADGKRIVAGGQDSVLRVWNGTDGTVLTTFPAPAPSTELADAGSQ